MINFKKKTAVFLTAVMITGCNPTVSKAAFAGEAVVSEAEVLTENSELQQAADVVDYNLNEMATFQGRTIEQVARLYSDAKYAGATYENGKSATYYTTPASTSAPYAAGVLTDDTHKTMTAMTNFYRWLVGVRPLTVVSANSTLLQSEALNRNFEFAHHISASSKPADMSDEIWNAGAECNHNILAMGYTPLGAITGWMNEGYSLSGTTWGTTGHRYALISDSLSDVQFGYSGNVAIGKDAARENESSYEGIYTFPAPGIMPNDLVSPNGSVWGVDYDTRLRYDDAANVVVTITNLTSGESVTRTADANTLQVSKGNILIVQPEDYNKTTNRYDASYQVVVSGLKETATGNAAQISYTVDFVDVRPYMDSYVEKVTFPYSEYGVYQTLNDTESLKKIGTTLPKTLTVTAENGCVYEVPVLGEWTLDEANSCWTNKGDASALPDNITDKKGVLNKVSFGYQILTESGYKYSTLNIFPASPKEGDQGTMSVYRYMMTSKHSKIYRLNETETGYDTVEVFDSATAANLSESGVTHIYSIDSFHASDSGEYISIYFNDGWTSTAYVSTSIPKLEINHTYTAVVTKEPSCAEEGVKTYTCKACGDTYTEPLDKLTTHDYESEIIKQPALNEQGEVRYTCNICGDTYTEYTDAVKDIADCDITLPQETYTYTGEECCPNVTVKNETETLTEGTDYAVSYRDNQNAGIAAVVISGKGKYAGKITKYFTIDKAENAVSISGITGKIFDGEPIVAPIVEEVTGQGTISYMYSDKKDGTYIGGLPEQAGSWYVKAVVEETENYKSAVSTAATVKIDKAKQADFSITNKPQAVTYGEQSISFNTSGGSGDGAVIWSITEGEGCASVNSATGEVSILHAGSVTITAIKSGGTNYTDITDTYTFDIAKKPITVTAKDKSVTYGEKNIVFEFDYNEADLAEGDTAAQLNVSLSSTATAKTGVGTYAITGKATKGDYNVEVVPGILTITPRKISVKGVEVEKKYFDETTDAMITNVLFNNISEGDKLVYKTDYDVTAAYTSAEVGTNEVLGTITFKNTKLTENYSLEDAEFVCTVSEGIRKRKPVYSVPTQITAVYGNTLASVKLPNDKNGTWTWKNNKEYVGNVGSNEFTAVFTPYDTENYSSIEENIKVTVKPVALNSNAKVKLSATSFNYTGSYKKPGVKSVVFNGKTLVYGTDYKISYTNGGKNKNIGSYRVIITGKGNYTGTVSAAYKITISKGKTYTVSGKKYKVTNAATNGKGTVTLVGVTASKSKLTSLTVGSTVKIGGKTFQITSIGAGACKGYKKLTKVTLGTNIKSIGSNAFYGCSKLKTITIKSKNLKTVGKKAIYGIYKKAAIKVPSSKYKAYKKLFKASTGFKGNMKLTK
ncbi:MAG: leucine-rich repeat protein [Clostridium sp.]|nr:leucine-rich repeat protein [Clostridium sp.]MCM1398656.1 leucine-rich repeat protein [Clostridium sp.]MCM1459941.1 leucine-rich repeat protein [Bacteroides sp.]